MTAKGIVLSNYVYLLIFLQEKSDCFPIKTYLHRYTVFYLPLKLMDIKLFPLFWQSWVIVAMNIATRNIWVQVFLGTYVFNSLGYIHLGTESLGHIITLCLALWGSAKMCSEADTAFCTLSSNGRGLQFLSSLANTCCFYSFDGRHSGWVQSGFHLRFLNDVRCPFSCVCWLLVYILQKNPSHIIHVGFYLGDIKL